MGAEQSALLACTETGKPEKPLRLCNAELFFQLYFDRMPEPQTGPITAALLHYIMNMPQNQTFDQDSGYDNEELEMDDMEERTDDEEDDEMEQDTVSEQADYADDVSSESGLSLESTSTKSIPNDNNSSDFELIPIEFVELQPIDLQDMDDSEMEFEQEFIIQVADLTTEDIED